MASEQRANMGPPNTRGILETEQNQAVIRQIKVEGRKMLQMEREIRVGVGWSEGGKDDEKDVEVGAILGYGALLAPQRL
ncbi:hypothetical protein AOLI_G00176170 [Acnodon oligacanthus]